MKHKFKNFFFGFLIVYFILHSVLLVYVQLNAYNDTTRVSDVAIVLGTSPNQSMPNPCLVARVRHADELYSQKKVSKIILSGAKLEDDYKSEAKIMRDVALQLGVKDSDIILEENSTSTFENLLFSQKILNSENFKSIILVSDPYHLPRAELVADKLKINYVVSPAIGSPCSTQRHNMLIYWITEPVKLIIYKLTGKI